MMPWRPSWRVTVFVISPAVLVASYVALWALRHRTLTYIIPCGYSGPIFIAYRPDAKADAHRTDYWNYEYRFDETGRLDVDGSLPVGPWMYPTMLEACDPPRKSGLDWNLVLGTRYTDGRELFDYTCHYPAPQTPEVCQEIVEEIQETRRARNREADHVP